MLDTEICVSSPFYYTFPFNKFGFYENKIEWLPDGRNFETSPIPQKDLNFVGFP